MPAIDLHQHLWPAGFVEALRARSAPPRIAGTKLVTIEGAFPFTEADHDVEARLAALDRDGIDLAVLCLQPTLGLELLSAGEREALENTWLTGVEEIGRQTKGRFRAFGPGRFREGCVGASVGAAALLEDSAAALLDELELSGGVLFVHPGPAAPGAGRPKWWPSVVDYTAQMQAAYFAWLADRRMQKRSLRVVFAMLAGGAPFQLERRARRGRDVRSALDERAFFEVSTYGRRAIELCIETFGVHRLVYGSDVPVVDPGPTLHAVRGFGESVARIIQIDTPTSLVT